MLLLQASLFDSDTPIALGDLPAAHERIALDETSWIELRRAWVTGSESLCRVLLDEVPWRSERRVMYDHVVDVPRLSCFYEKDALLPHEALASMRDALFTHYEHVPGGKIESVGLCQYRDGRDSVAWHGDRIGRGASHDVVVAIVSLGAARALLIRPRGGGSSRRFVLESGDLFVMGGACQRRFEHCVPKTKRTVGSRISVQFRAADVR